MNPSLIILVEVLGLVLLFAIGIIIVMLNPSEPKVYRNFRLIVKLGMIFIVPLIVFHWQYMEFKDALYVLQENWPLYVAIFVAYVLEKFATRDWNKFRFLS